MAHRTYYPTFVHKTQEYARWLQERRAKMEQQTGITAGSAQDAQLTAIQTALAAITPANGWPLYDEAP